VNRLIADQPLVGEAGAEPTHIESVMPSARAR
jgi:hypothetical protein